MTKDNLLDVIQLLIDHGADVKNNTNWILRALGYWRSPLHIVLRQNYENENLIDIVQLFVEKGSELNVEDEYGHTPLHLVCKFYKKDDMKDIIQLLINKGVDVNANYPHGKQPLHYLCCNNENSNIKDIVQLLIEKGAEVNAKEKAYGWTPLHLLCSQYKK